MISLQRAVKPADVKAFIARNSGTGDIKAHFKVQGATGKTQIEIERSWLIAKGGTGNDMNTLWSTYLASKGFTVGTLASRMKAFFKTGTQA